MAFEERIQHNMSSLHRLRFQALSKKCLHFTMHSSSSADISDFDRLAPPFLFLLLSMARRH